MKKNIVALIFMATFISGGLSAQSTEGVTPEMMSAIEKAYDANDVATKALTNAVSNNDVKKLLLNRTNVGQTDHFFKYRVLPKPNITDQKKSGRCWMFTSMNMLRPSVLTGLNLSEFEFSQNYLYFWDLFEKSNLFFEIMIKNRAEPIDNREVNWAFGSPIGDGGVWIGFANLAQKYGLVPKTAMPETVHSSNTRALNSVLRRKLREHGITIRQMAVSKKSEKEIRNAKIGMLGDVYRLLCLHLGQPPKEFTWRYEDKNKKVSEAKTYTPQSFMKVVLPNLELDNYIMLMNDPTRDYYKLYEIEYDRNVMEGRNWKYINLPNDALKKAALASIKGNEAMYASCDVGKQLNSEEGLASMDNYDYESLFGVRFSMDKKARILSRQSGSSHGMALVAVDVDGNEKTTKWQFENSWGKKHGQDGYLSFTDEWFDEYMFRIVVLKKFLDKKVLDVLTQDPIKLPPWDPMFSMDK